MMASHLSVIDPEKDARWDHFVRDHLFAQIYHSSTWKQVIEKSFKHIRGQVLILQESEGKRIQAGLPIYEVRSWLTGTRLVSAPFTTLFDPLVSDQRQLDFLLSEVIRLVDQKGFSYAEIRTLRSSSVFHYGQFGKCDFFKHHYLRLDEPIEDLKKGFHRTCVRQRLSRAEKSGFLIRLADNERDLMGFYDLLRMTRRRLALFTQPFQAIKSIWDFYHPTDNVKIIMAQKGTHIAAAIMIFFFKDRASIEYSVHDESYLHQSPIHILFWEGIKLAQKSGCRIIDFGRTSSINHRLLDFKRRWGTQEVDLVHYFYPSHKSRMYETREKSAVIKMVRKVAMSSLSKPVYDLFSGFIHRHLG